MNDSKKIGRTFWDFSSENLIVVLGFFVIVVIIVTWLILNGTTIDAGSIKITNKPTDTIFMRDTVNRLIKIPNPIREKKPLKKETESQVINNGGNNNNSIINGGNNNIVNGNNNVIHQNDLENTPIVIRYLKSLEVNERNKPISLGMLNPYFKYNYYMEINYASKLPRGSLLVCTDLNFEYNLGFSFLDSGTGNFVTFPQKSNPNYIAAVRHDNPLPRQYYVHLATNEVVVEFEKHIHFLIDGKVHSFR